MTRSSNSVFLFFAEVSLKSFLLLLVLLFLSIDSLVGNLLAEWDFVLSVIGNLECEIEGNNALFWGID